MKTNTMIFRPFPLLAIAAACLAGPGSVALLAARDAPSTSRVGATERSSAVIGERAAEVNVTRASNFLGADVRASDGRKVGDIIDYVFDMSESPHLAYVVVMTGGFLEMGGEARAVPASAIRTEDEGRCLIDISSEEYLKVPVLSGDRVGFLSDRRQADEIARAFKVDQRRDARGRVDERARAPGSLVSFSELRNANIYGNEGKQLGFCVDAWVDLDLDRAPFVEITPTFRPFLSEQDLRYAVPMARFASRGEFGRLEFTVDGEELAAAEPATEAPGVRTLEWDPSGNAILRVRVAEAGAQPRQMEGAE